MAAKAGLRWPPRPVPHAGRCAPGRRAAQPSPPARYRAELAAVRFRSSQGWALPGLSTDTWGALGVLHPWVPPVHPGGTAFLFH